MPKLELDEETIKIFRNIIKRDTNEKIEEFIKERIDNKNYSYHQIQIIIKLFMNQFNISNGNLKFLNSQGEDITDTCIDYFFKSIKPITNGGFAKLIMNKKDHIKDKIDLCLDAYENDLKEVNCRTQLIFIDKNTKKCKFEILTDEISEKKINNKLYKNVDILYLIDATESMGYEIKAINDNFIKVIDKLTKKYKDIDFRFGAVFYRDIIDSPEDKNEYFSFTSNIRDLEKNFTNIKSYGGGKGISEDWVEGYNLALNHMNWRNGINLIIHITDAGAHGKEFSKGDKYYDEGPKLIKLIQQCTKENINILGFKISEDANQSFKKITEIFNENKKQNQFIEIYDFKRELFSEKITEKIEELIVKENNQVNNQSYKFLERLKFLLNTSNDLEEDEKDKKSLLSILDIDSYSIIEDNYKKMLFLLYRIQANIPVIIMGETGCGKTSLIIKLNKMFNNGENLVQIININSDFSDEKICLKMREMNSRAKYKKNELWVLFDEINTCSSFSLLTEIFINRTFNGEKLEDNIKLIGACCPYRRRKQLNENNQLVYKVEQLPQSLLYYVFNFGSLDINDEKKYIKNIIQILFTKEEEKLHNLTTEAISICHIFLRKLFDNDPSIVSLRDITRFKIIVEFFEDYFIKKNEYINIKINNEKKKVNKIKSIICSIYICYYFRLINEESRGSFDNTLKKILLKISNVYYEGNENNKNYNLFSQIKYPDLRNELMGKNFYRFSDLLKIEEDFLIEQIELGGGIGKNRILKENLFLIFLSIITKIPLIIVGKPPTGKSLSVQLIYNSMRKPKNDKKSFFTKYQKINQIYFQRMESTVPEDVETLFKKIEDLCHIHKMNNIKNDLLPIYMILFDKLELAEKSSMNLFKALYNKLELNVKTKEICFIGISNDNILDPIIANKSLILSLPKLEDKLDQLKIIAKSIVENISGDIYKETIIFNILVRAYQLYKYYLNFIKKLTVLKKYSKGKNLKGKNFREIEFENEYIKLFKMDKKINSDFHGNNDFYNLIKGVALEGSKLNNILDESEIVPIINYFIERNFGGISYDIDIDFNMEFDDIKFEMEELNYYILNEKIKKRNKHDDEDNIIKVNSVYLFKKIYNKACDLEKLEDSKIIDGIVYKIKTILHAKSESFRYGLGQNYTVRLLNQKGVGIPNKNVYLYINGERIKSKTNENGVARFKIAQNTGKYSTYIKFFNEDEYYGSSKNTVISVIKGKTYIKAFNSNTSCPSKAAIKIKFYNANNQPIKNTVLYTTINKKTYKKVTNNTGEIALHIQLDPGNYKTMIYYEGSANLKTAQKNITVTVNKGKTKSVLINAIINIITSLKFIG